MASYYVWSGATGSANGSSWANAYTAITTAFSGKSAGDIFYVAHDHSESLASSPTLNLGTIGNPVKVICVSRAGSVPPVSADRRATAQIATTSTNFITLNGCAHYDGMIFSGATGAAGGAALLIAQAANTFSRFDNCSLRIGNTSASGGITIGTASIGGVYVELNNTTLSFAAVGQTLTINGTLKWRNTPSALLGTILTSLFSPTSARGNSIECIGVDFSAAGSGKTLVAAPTSQGGAIRFIDCKLDAAVTKSGVQAGYGSCDVDFVRSGATGVNYTVYSQRVGGLLTEETTIVRTGGASDGTTAIAWKVVSTANCTYSMPFECPPIAIWNDTTGSAITATVECIGAAIATDQEVWLDVEYLGDASSPQGSFVNDGKADLLATAANQTSSSETWGGSTAAFKLAVTFTPQQKGWIYARVKIGKASSTFYIDALITLT